MHFRRWDSYVGTRNKSLICVARGPVPGKRGGVTSRTMDAIELGAFFASLPEDSRIHHRMVDIHSYFAELSQYKFMIAPRGNGIQSPKFLEAILVGLA